MNSGFVRKNADHSVCKKKIDDKIIIIIGALMT